MFSVVLSSKFHFSNLYENFQVLHKAVRDSTKKYWGTLVPYMNGKKTPSKWKKKNLQSLKVYICLLNWGRKDGGGGNLVENSLFIFRLPLVKVFV